MKIRFHGAAQTVTGSMHLIEINGKKLLLDCGLFQGRRQDTYERNKHFPFQPSQINAVILSHAHIDHSGNLPNLVNQGFQGFIYATPATKDLTEIMLRDSAHIQESDILYLNKRRQRNHQAPVEPLYTKEDVEQVLPKLMPVPYGAEFSPLPGVTARLLDAGHILGSASVHLQLEEKGKTTSLCFSGDIGRRDLPLLQDPVLPEPADLLIMESTYGDKNHNDPQAAISELNQALRHAVEHGGKVIIPAFSVGRTQELVYSIHNLIHENKISPLPVYVDSPLAVNATDIFKKHRECFDEETWQFMQRNQHPALDFEGLTYIRSVEESKALNERKDPMVIIAASGMAEGGRILHHLKNNIENPKNTVLIISWQAPHTLGRRIADRDEKIKIFGETYTRRAQVITIGGFSAHAGQSLLTEYAKAAQAKKHGVYLVHGEETPALVLKEKLAEQGMKNVHYPVLHQSLEV